MGGRKTIYFVLAVAAALASPAAGATGSGEPRPGEQPNIVFVLADDLGYGDLGCYGQRRFRTPRLDSLAAEGMRFTQCYAGSTVCAPSRCSLLTGLHTGHARIRGNDFFPLGPDDLTVAEVLRRAGYATGMFGKWGVGDAGTTGSPERKGFDESLGYLDNVHAHRHYTDHLFRDGASVPVDPREYAEDIIVAAALDFVRRHRDGPFFLYLPVTIPHAELLVPADSLAGQAGRFPEEPFVNLAADRHPEKPGYRSQPAPRAAFAAMVTRLDRLVGSLLSLLDELGLRESTVVFFSSDNGPHREGGADPDFFKSAGPFRGIKRDMYEGGIRVPMIVRWPGKVPAGVVSDAVWAFWDFLPTAAAIAGVGAPHGIDGVSVVPALRGGSLDHAPLYWEFFERGFQQAARMGDWKAVRLGPGWPLELYRLPDDLGEDHDLAREHPEVVAAMEAFLRAARTESEHWKVPRGRRL